MRWIVILALVGFSTVVMAEESREVSMLRAKCEKEKVSLFRENNGTPSCDKLAKAIEQDRQRSSETTYRWNGAAGKYCYYNGLGEITMCP